MTRHRRSMTWLLAVACSLAVTAGIAWAAPDAYRAEQWGLDRIRAPQAWSTTRGQGVLVAIVDSGVDLAHPDLVDRLARRADGSLLGRDFVDPETPPDDENGHGTLVAGIVAATADNGVGIAGVAPAVRLMPVRVLDAEGNGDGRDVEDAIRWAVDNGADVVNLSFESAGGGRSGLRLPIPAPDDAVDYAWSHGVVVVAAAGNDASSSDDYPADSPVLLVGATDRDDERAAFSDTVREDAVVAPGVDIYSTWWCDPSAGSDRCPAEHGYGRATGTSFSAPHVSGAVALLRATGLDHEQAVQRLRDTARDIGAPGPDDGTGRGLIDVAAAIGATPSPTPSAPSPTPSPQPRPSVTAAQPPGEPPAAAPSAAPTPSATPSPTEAAPTRTAPPSTAALDGDRDGDAGAGGGTTGDAPRAAAPADRSGSVAAWRALAAALVALTGAAQVAAARRS